MTRFLIPANTLVNDQPDVATYPNRPEILVPCFGELVEAHARIGRVELEVEGRGLDGFLFLTSQPSETVGKGIGNAEVHCARDRRHAGQAFGRTRAACCARTSARSLRRDLANSGFAGSLGHPVMSA